MQIFQKQIENQTKKQKSEFLVVLLGTLVASPLMKILTAKGE